MVPTRSQHSRSPDPRILGPEGMVIGAYAALTIIYMLPVLVHLTEAIPSGTTPGDNWQFYWNLWWIKRSLLERHMSPFFTTEVFYPEGSPLYFHTLHLVPSLLVLPVAAVCGLPAGYNLMVLMAPFFGAYGAYRLALDQLGNGNVAATDRGARGAAFLGGILFAFNRPHMIHAAGGLNLLSTQWVPFYALFLFRSWRRQSASGPLGAATFFALGSLTDWHYTLFLLTLSALFLAYHGIADVRRPDFGAALGRTTTGIAAGLALVAPVLVPTLLAGRHTGRVADPYGSSVEMSADLLAFVIPSPLHPSWAPGMPVPRGGGAFPGYLPLTACLAAAGGLWRLQRFWLVAFAAFSALALGPVLQVAGAPVHIGGREVPLPFALVHRIPWADIFRAPDRFTMMGSLCLAVLTAQALVLLRRRFVGGARPDAVLALATVAALAENAPLRFRLARIEIPPYYELLAADPRRLAVLELPTARDPVEDAERMLYQTRHEKPLYGGYLSRGRPPVPLEALPGFGQLATLSHEVDDIVAYDPHALPAISRRVLSLYAAGHVVIDKRRLTGERLEQARGVVSSILPGLPPSYEDSVTLAYAIPAPTEAPAFIYLHTGWSDRETPPMGRACRWMGARGRLGLFAPRAGTWRLSLRGWSYGHARRVAVAVDGRPLPPLRVVPQPTTIHTDSFTVSAGVHVIELQSLDEVARVGVERRISVAITLLRLEE